MTDSGEGPSTPITPNQSIVRERPLTLRWEKGKSSKGAVTPNFNIRGHAGDAVSSEKRRRLTVYVHVIREDGRKAFAQAEAVRTWPGDLTLSISYKQSNHWKRSLVSPPDPLTDANSSKLN